MKFLVVCLLLLTCIVALSIQHSEGFFNAPASSDVPQRVAVTTCIRGDIVTFKARTTDNSTIQNVYLVYHSSKKAVAAEEFTDRIVGDVVTVTPTESFIGNQMLSSMVIDKTYYVIQVITPSDPNAKKYQGNQPATTARNKLLGVFTYSRPPLCPVDTDSRPLPPPLVPAPSPAPAPAPAPTPAPAPAPAKPTPPPRAFDRQEPSSAAISDTSAQAKSLKQRMDILSDVQTLLKKKTLESRRLPPQKRCDSDCNGSCNGGCEKEEAPSSDALTQGQEYKKACDHDMTQYIRKDSIPCWKCNLDY